MPSITFRVRQDERDQLQAKAKDRGKSLSEYVRGQVLGTYEVEKELGKATTIKPEEFVGRPAFEARIKELSKTVSSSAARKIAYQEGLRP